jgi:hypothetical protein
MSFGTAAETTKEPINYIKELMLRFPGMNIKVVGNLTWQRRKSTFTDQEHYCSLPLFQGTHHFQLSTRKSCNGNGNVRTGRTDFTQSVFTVICSLSTNTCERSSFDLLIVQPFHLFIALSLFLFDTSKILYNVFFSNFLLYFINVNCCNKRSSY